METRNRTKTKATNRAVFTSHRVACPQCGHFTKDLKKHRQYRCSERLRLCGRCGRDVKGGSLICARCDEGGAHVDEQKDRQTLDVYIEDGTNEEDEEQEAREEYYGL